MKRYIRPAHEIMHMRRTCKNYFRVHMYRFEKYLKMKGFLEMFLKIKSALKITGKLPKGFEKFLKLLFSVELNQIQFKIVLLHQIKAKPIFIDLLILCQFASLSEKLNYRVYKN